MVNLWEDIPFLLSLARAGTLSGAARDLKIDRTTVARRVEQLEETRKEPLFERLDGRFMLTIFARKLFTAAQNAEKNCCFLINLTRGRRIMA